MDSSLPDKDDPNFYCKKCDKKLRYLSTFRKHLHDFHKINIITPRPKLNLEIQPDINDPNFYCLVCKKNYKGNKDYRRHIKHVYKVDVPSAKKRPKYDPGMKKDDVNDKANTRCIICKLGTPKQKVLSLSRGATQETRTCDTFEGKIKDKSWYYTIFTRPQQSLLKLQFDFCNQSKL